MTLEMKAWRTFEGLSLEGKEAILKAASEKPHAGQRGPDSEIKGFSELVLFLHQRIDEHRLGSDLQRLLNDANLES